MVSPFSLFTFLYLYLAILLYPTYIHSISISSSPPQRNGSLSSLYMDPSIQHVDTSRSSSATKSQHSIVNETSTTLGFVDSYPDRRYVLQINGTGDDSVTLTLLLEQHLDPSNYTFVINSNDTKILQTPSDISTSRSDSLRVTNLTIALDFQLFPGLCQLQVEARRVSDDSLFDSCKIDFLVAGIAVYVKRSYALISGVGRSYTIPSYEDIKTKPHQEFGVFVQYVNGSNSNQIISSEVINNNKGGLPPPSSSLTFDSIISSFMSYSGQILWDDAICSINGGTWTGDTSVKLEPGCGMGFSPAFSKGQTFDGYRFAYNFQPNRAGTIGVLFTWNGFTTGSDLEDEELTNYVIIIIRGQPPSIVRGIEPANPFSTYGGEELYVEFINTVDVDVLSFDVNGVQFEIIPGSRTVINGPDDFYETAKFLTKPGTGKQLPWTVSANLTSSNGTKLPVQFIDETGFLFSYDDEDVILLEMNPSSIGEDGNVQVTLTGIFPGFDGSKKTHNVCIGNTPVGQDRIISSTDATIVVLIPPRLSIGSSWMYSIYVQIGVAYSNELFIEFFPTSLELRGIVFGASFDGESETYKLNYCGRTTFIVTVIDQPEAKNVTREWKLFDDANVEYLSSQSSIVRNTDTLDLPNDIIPRFDEKFYVTARVSLHNITSVYLFNVIKSEHNVIGVTLIQPENRTISNPMVNMRIIAKIDLPHCSRMPNELTYQWELENKSETIEASSRIGRNTSDIHDQALPPKFNKYIFSYINGTGTSDSEITPTRLGREIIIPVELVTQGFHRVRLTVYGNDPKNNNTLITGHDRTSYTVYDSPLIAMIGTGQLSRRISDVEALTMTAQGSYDPDLVSSSDKSMGLSYEWGCNMSVYFNMSNMIPCRNELLPNKSSEDQSNFEVSKDILRSVTNETIKGSEEHVYLRYQMTISKHDRSSTAIQELTLSVSNGLAVSRYNRIHIVNSRDETINVDAVEFWDAVIIRPVAPASTEWRFRLELPTWERSRFFTHAGNLISSAGYYTVSGQMDSGFQQLPLGIQADRLDPKQTYQFLISFQEAGKLTDDVQLRLKTVEVPELVFPALSQSNGSTSTTFRATASTSFNGLSQFTYQFYLIELGRISSEYCVDGCTGAHTVRFQIPKIGLYTLQCRLLSANGKRLLSVRNNTKIITVYDTSSILSTPSVSTKQTSTETKDAFSRENDVMDRDFKLGDDGWVIQRGFYASESLYENGDEIGGPVKSSATYDLCVNHTSIWLDYPTHIIANELPNTPNARNYVSYATNFARLSCVEQEDSLMKLVKIVDRSITRTPQEEVLTTSTNSESKDLPNVELHEELRRFYNFSFAKAMQLVTKGSTRNRLLSQPGLVHNLILDVAEQAIKHLTTAATSGRVCGWEERYTFETRDGVPDTLSSSSDTSSIISRSKPEEKMKMSKNQKLQKLQPASTTALGVTSVYVAVKCNPEQGMSATTPNAEFEWCDTVYAISGDSRKLITLAETFDYPYLSGVQGNNKSDTERVVLVDITTLGQHNRLETTISSESLVAEQVKEAERIGGIKQQTNQACYRVRMKMSSHMKSSAPIKVDRTANCWINQPYRMSPRKPFEYNVINPYHADMYLARKIGISASDDTRNSSLNVTAETNYLGLYGAHRKHCGIGYLDGNSVMPDSTILAGFFIGILLLIIIITGLTYLLVAIIVGTSTTRDDDSIFVPGAEAYVERDFFGRNQVSIHVLEDISSGPSARLPSSASQSFRVSRSHHSTQSTSQWYTTGEERLRHNRPSEAP